MLNSSRSSLPDWISGVPRIPCSLARSGADVWVAHLESDEVVAIDVDVVAFARPMPRPQGAR